MLRTVWAAGCLLAGVPQQVEVRVVLHRAFVEEEVLEEERQCVEPLKELAVLL